MEEDGFLTSFSASVDETSCRGLYVCRSGDLLSKDDISQPVNSEDCHLVVQELGIKGHPNGVGENLELLRGQKFWQNLSYVAKKRWEILLTIPWLRRRGIKEGAIHNISLQVPNLKSRSHVHSAPFSNYPLNSKITIYLYFRTKGRKRKKH